MVLVHQAVIVVVIPLVGRAAGWPLRGLARLLRAVTGVHAIRREKHHCRAHLLAP
jgi:hypothetical protein